MVAMPDPNTRPAVCDNIIPELHPAGDPAPTDFTVPGYVDISGMAAFPIPTASANHSWCFDLRGKKALVCGNTQGTGQAAVLKLALPGARSRG